MFDFNIELESGYEGHFSFVGIYFNKSKRKTVFRLPKGYDVQKYKSAEQKRDLFFKFYRMFKIYAQILEEKKNFNQAQNDRQFNQKIYSQFQSFDIEVEHQTEQVIFYNQFNCLDDILEQYDELKIFNIAFKLNHSNKIYYDKLYLNLDKVIYLSDDEDENDLRFFIDQNLLPSPQITFNETDLITMYCYILSEIQTYLTPQEEFHADIIVLANQFKEKYLNNHDSLFDVDSWENTINILKECLDKIHQFTALKSPDFWDFYNAIEKFLYGRPVLLNEEGYLWGLNNFAFVWESMCLTNLLTESLHSNYTVIYLDALAIPNKLLEKIYQQSLENNAFKFATMKFLESSSELEIDMSTLRPDAIISYGKFYKIIDVKYYDQSEFSNNPQSKQVIDSIRKQYLYEYLLNRYFADETVQISSEFWLPNDQDNQNYYGNLLLFYKNIDNMINIYNQNFSIYLLNIL